VVQDFIGKLTDEEKRRSIEYLKGWFLRYDMPEYADRLSKVTESGTGSAMKFRPAGEDFSAPTEPTDQM
jgi:hypothetical protein